MTDRRNRTGARCGRNSRRPIHADYFAQKIVCGRRLRRRFRSPPQAVVVTQRRFGVGDPSHRFGTPPIDFFEQSQRRPIYRRNRRLCQNRRSRWSLHRTKCPGNLPRPLGVRRPNPTPTKKRRPGPSLCGVQVKPIVQNAVRDAPVPQASTLPIISGRISPSDL